MIAVLVAATLLAGAALASSLAAYARRMTARRRVSMLGPGASAGAAAPTIGRLRGRLGGGPGAGVELPAMLDGVARSVRSGSSLRQALMAATPRGALAEPTRRLRHDLDVGVPLGRAIGVWAQRVDDRSVDLAAAALVVATDIGASGVDAVDAVAATVRDRLATGAEARAHAAQARASAWAMGLLPLGFFAAAVATDAAAVDFFVADPTGLTCLVAGLTLDAVGLWWMRRIVEAPAW